MQHMRGGAGQGGGGGNREGLVRRHAHTHTQTHTAAPTGGQQFVPGGSLEVINNNNKAENKQNRSRLLFP